MKIFLILTVLLTITSCGLKAPTVGGKKKVNITPEAQEYVLSFQAKYARTINNLEVVIRPLEAGILAYCQYGGNMTPLVVLNSIHWNGTDGRPEITNAQKEEVVYHELGHCVLKRGHDDSFIAFDSLYPDSKEKKSIMSTYHLGQKTYTDHYSHYVNELFGTNAFAGITFDDTMYASTMPEFPEFVEPEIEVLTAEQIQDCVHVVKAEENDGHEHNEEMESVQE